MAHLRTMHLPRATFPPLYRTRYMVLHGDDAEVCIASFFSLLGFLFSFILDVTMQVPHVKGSIWIYACQKLIR